MTKFKGFIKIANVGWHWGTRFIGWNKMVDTLLNWIFYNIFAVSGKWQLHLLKVAIWQRWFLIRETQLLYWNNVQLFKFPIDKNYSFYTYFWDPFLFPLSPCPLHISLLFQLLNFNPTAIKKMFYFLFLKEQQWSQPTYVFLIHVTTVTSRCYKKKSFQ